MAKDIEHLHWKNADTSQSVPHAPVIKVNRGNIVLIAGCTSAPMYHSHPHVPEESDNMPAAPGGQARSALEGMKKSLKAASAVFDDVVECTRFATGLSDQDAMNEVWGP